MKQATCQKVINVTPPAAIIDNNSAVTNSIDTTGFRYCQILVMLGATDIALTALKVQESDTDGSYADITGLVFGASGAPALPSATADNGVYAFNIDLRGRKKFLDLVITFGDGTVGGFVAAIALLFEGEELPDSATKRGLAAELTV
jgi:hypothetical protein